MGQYNKYSLKDVFTNILLAIVLALLLLLPAYFCYKVFIANTNVADTQQLDEENILIPEKLEPETQ